MITIAPRFAFASSAFSASFLQVQIERGDYVVSRHRRRNDFLRSFAAILVESQFVFAVLAGEHVVERLLEPFASLRFRPEHFVVVDDAVRIPAGLSGITNDLPGHLSVRISPDVNRTHHHSGRQLSLISSYSCGVRFGAISNGRMPRLR